jgi:hypothetical protein
MSVRTLGGTPTARKVYRDYTAERLAAEGKKVGAAPPPPPAAKSWYERLGEDEEKRKALYRRIERLCLARGKEVELWVYEAAEKAGGAAQPDRYFCAAIVRMLRLVEVHSL